MEDKIKVLETKLKLRKDIDSINNTLLYNLQELAVKTIEVLNATYDGNNKGDTITHIFTREQKQILEDLIYTAKSKELTSQNTKDYIRQYAREKEIKQEILNGL